MVNKWSNLRNHEMLGKTVKCLVLSLSEKDNTKYMGYTENMKLVNITSNKNITGKIVDVSSMSDDIANDLIESAQIHLGGPNSSITNQDTMTYTLGQDHKQSGVFMLGNRGFKLSTGIMLLLLNFKKQ